jgi:serine phosphatase RsbU (regulator of sigma subunit)
MRAVVPGGWFVEKRAERSGGEAMAVKSRASSERDVLVEASAILQEPSRNTKRKILSSITGTLGLLFTFHVVLQLATTGHLPYPERDNIMFSVSIVVFLGSAVYNIAVLLGRIKGSARWDLATQWATVVVLQAFCLAIVHMNPNTATSLLIDHSFSIATIFITGVILGRRAAVLWFIITILSLVIAVHNRGVGFTYHLMTQAEVERLKIAESQDPGAAAARLQELLREKILPLPVILYALVSVILTLLAALTTYFEAGMIGQVLAAIPTAIEKIQIAAKEKEKLEQENVRLGTELDVAQRIQAMILPREAELSRCGDLEVMAQMQPATEVGGDLYEVLRRPDGSITFAIGDVTDHGLASGLVMLMSQTALRTCLEDPRFDLVQSLVHVNAVIFKNVQERMGDFRNLTLALLEYKEGRVRLAGQHESVLVLRKGSDSVEEIETTDLGCAIGLVDDVGPMTSETSFELSPGDLMLLYTDGVTEAEDGKGEQYGTERLKESIVRHREVPIKDIVPRLVGDVTRWIGQAPIYDDITVVVARRIG